MPSSGCARPSSHICVARQAHGSTRLDQLRLSLGYERVLARGFALVHDENGALLQLARDVAPDNGSMCNFRTAMSPRAPRKKPARSPPPPCVQNARRRKTAAGRARYFDEPQLVC